MVRSTRPPALRPKLEECPDCDEFGVLSVRGKGDVVSRELSVALRASGGAWVWVSSIGRLRGLLVELGREEDCLCVGNRGVLSVRGAFWVLFDLSNGWMEDDGLERSVPTPIP